MKHLISNENCQLLCPLKTLYGDSEGNDLFSWLKEKLNNFRLDQDLLTGPQDQINEKDSIIITYADQFSSVDELPLRTLKRFSAAYLDEVVSGIHLLPFFPWSSDDGFSVIDYRAVDPLFGSWQDVKELGENFKLMFDAVINHISSKSKWFLEFLEGEPKYENYFITMDPAEDLSMVVRPRTSPLLTLYASKSGDKWVWTTFSADQIDLNYKNPQVFKDVVEILLFYIQNGAYFIRLDAIAYLWKEKGTKSIHLPQTHAIIHLFNSIIKEIAPHVKLITETNVPHKENVSYFGDGSDEAHLVYNFALPPLILHTFYSQNTKALTDWAAALSLPSNEVTFFNFLASHDGIGITPVQGLISEKEIEQIVKEVLNRRGLISYKKNPDNSESPYELNISYFDALSLTKENYGSDNHINRFLCAHAIMFSIVGLPGIYIHSMLGSPSWHKGVNSTGHRRTINRKKYNIEEITKELSDIESVPSKVYQGIKALLQNRTKSSAFHPHGAQLVIDINPSIFSIIRISPQGDEIALCLHNITSTQTDIEIDPEGIGLSGQVWRDIITDHVIDLSGKVDLNLDPYQVAWFKQENTR